MLDQEFLKVLKTIEREKDIPLEDLSGILKEALEHAYRKHFGARGEIQVEINWDEGRVSFFQRKLVVDVVQDDHLEMSEEDAQQLDPSLKTDSSVDIEVTPRDFGRIAAQTAKQILVQRIREKERDIVFAEYAHRVGEVLSSQVSRVDGRTVFVNIGKTEAILPYSEQIPNERYRVGDRLKVYLLKVEETQRMPHIVLSRAHPNIIVKLFALEVPEVQEGVVEVRSLAREPGARTKIAVLSHQDNVDPVGACVGHRGSRVQAVVDELRGEKIDIIRWSEDAERMIAAALQPARVTQVVLRETPEQAAEEGHRPSATVIVPDDQLSLAIGREGQNVKLAANLTNWRLDIRSGSQYREEQAIAAASVPAAGSPPETGETVPSAEPTAAADEQPADVAVPATSDTADESSEAPAPATPETAPPDDKQVTGPEDTPAAASADTEHPVGASAEREAHNGHDTALAQESSSEERVA